MDRTRERFDVDGLVGPYKGEVEQDLERAETMITGIEELLNGTDLQGWEETYSTLAGQMREYNDWVRAEILPRAREDYRLPPEMYADALKNWGVDASPEQLIEQATKGYMDIRNEMESLAPQIAREKGYETSDYREVIALLKRDGAIDGDKMLDHYNAILRDIEEIIVREKIISLPGREAGIRIASAAETAVQPAPHLDIPRLLGNTGEFPNFVIPQLIQNDDGSWVQTDDTYVALNEATKEPAERWVPYAGVPGTNHLGYAVDDAEGLRRRLAAAGYRDSTIPNDHPHRRRVYFYDSEGNDWEFVEYRSDDPSERNDYDLPDAT